MAFQPMKEDGGYGSIKFWQGEIAILDKLYQAKGKEWDKLEAAYDLDYKRKIRDLQKSELVDTSEFYPLARAIIATVAMNYPRLMFDVTDDEAHADDIGIAVDELLERAASSLFKITDLKPTVHQALFQSLFTGLSWIRTDINAKGDEITSPWRAIDPDEEDLVSFTYVSARYVHPDPQGSPHKLEDKRYIREVLWIPLEQLKSDAKRLREAGFNWYDGRALADVKGSSPAEDEMFGFPQVDSQAQDADEAAAIRESILNGDFVKCDRIHDRMGGRLILFAAGVDKPIMERPHPFLRRVFDQRTDAAGRLMYTLPDGTVIGIGEDDGEQAQALIAQSEPLLDLETKGSDGDLGEPGVGWLCRHGFPFTPVKPDLHPISYNPKGQLFYIEKLQDLIVESLSRKASLLKRFSRHVIVTQKVFDHLGESGMDKLRMAEDGEHTIVPDGTTRDDIFVLDMSGIPAGQNDIEDRAQLRIDRTTKVNELTSQGSGDMSATQSALIGAAVEVNRAWMEAMTSGVYVDTIRNGFQTMGCPRYTPENFKVNVAPGGQKRLSRALTAADFLWHYSIEVQAFSMQPLFSQMQQDKMLAFYDRAVNDPNYDKRKLSKLLAGAFDQIGDPEKLMIDDTNPEAVRAAQLENQYMILRQQDPGVLPEQDHRSHMETHAQYQADPTYQQITQRAQMMGAGGIPADPQAAMAVQQIDQLIMSHNQMHAQADQQQSASLGRTEGRTSAAGPQSLISQVQSNAQEVSQAAQAQEEEVMQR